ncbi:hypothetical protein [Schaalia hyovaginalis]|uniref:hypothetical protein n=1 Tax=Schaalia hyovaginalis TaxID=29316 RepID=UPI0026F36984|nr:hypothetical protein [Schaalia hyovaginalis]MCI6410149.1 hypothetical protein [Schaalia hyovaginalis]
MADLPVVRASLPARAPFHASALSPIPPSGPLHGDGARTERKKRTPVLALACLVILELAASTALGLLAWKEHRLNIELERESRTIGVVGAKA